MGAICLEKRGDRPSRGADSIGQVSADLGNKLSNGVGCFLGFFQVRHMATLANPMEVAMGNSLLKFLGVCCTQDAIVLAPNYQRWSLNVGNLMRQKIVPPSFGKGTQRLIPIW